MTSYWQAEWVKKFGWKTIELPPPAPAVDQQAVCVTMRQCVFRGVCGEIFALFQACVGNFDTIMPWKVVGTLYLDSSCVSFKYLLSWAFVTSLNCSVMCKPPWWFECYFRRSTWIHCWLLLAVLSNYFGQLVTSTSLLFKFWVLPWSTPVSFPVMRRWKCLIMKRLSQTSRTSPGKGAEKLAQADLKRVTQNPGRVCFILNQKR